MLINEGKIHSVAAHLLDHPIRLNSLSEVGKLQQSTSPSRERLEGNKVDFEQTTLKHESPICVDVGPCQSIQGICMEEVDVRTTTS